MNQTRLEENIREQGTDLFARIHDHSVSVFSISYWTGKVMDWGMAHEGIREKLFGLIQTLPELETDRMVFEHLQSHFLSRDIPVLMRLGLRTAAVFGPLGRWAAAGVVRTISRMIARQFIIGSETDETIRRIRKLRDKDGFAFTLDVLGEETRSEANVREYVNGYIQFLDRIKDVLPHWKALGDGDAGLDWGDSPIVNVSIKPSALCVHAEEIEPAEAVERMLTQLKPIYRKVIESGGFLCIDNETLRLREVIFELYRRLRSDAEFRHYPYLGVVMQVYMKDYAQKLDELLTWARAESLPISLRLVKGAYWDHEVAVAKANHQPIPVHEIKAQSDIAFENAARTILQNSDMCHLACASHNVRSVVAVAETARMLNVGQDRLEFQALYGMAEAFRKAVRQMTPRVRLYCPYGNLLYGMAYLVRRLIENSSNESFLKLTLAEDADVNKLLENPRVTLEKKIGQTP